MFLVDIFENSFNHIILTFECFKLLQASPWNCVFSDGSFLCLNFFLVLLWTIDTYNQRRALSAYPCWFNFAKLALKWLINVLKTFQNYWSLYIRCEGHATDFKMSIVLCTWSDAIQISSSAMFCCLHSLYNRLSNWQIYFSIFRPPKTFEILVCSGLWKLATLALPAALIWNFLTTSMKQ